MVAIAYTDVTTPAPRATHVSKRRAHRSAYTADPVVGMATRLLSGPLHQVYALLWRAGLLVVDD